MKLTNLSAVQSPWGEGKEKPQWATPLKGIVAVGKLETFMVPPDKAIKFNIAS